MPGYDAEPSNKQLLLRFLLGELPPDEARRVQERLDDEPRLAAQLRRMRALQQTLEASAARSFEPGFAQRVTQQIRPRAAQRRALSPFDALYEALVGIFVRTAIAAVLLIGMLGAINAIQYHEVDATTSAIEAAFGLPEVTLDRAMDEAVVYVNAEE